MDSNPQKRIKSASGESQSNFNNGTGSTINKLGLYGSSMGGRSAGSVRFGIDDRNTNLAKRSGSMATQELFGTGMLGSGGGASGPSFTSSSIFGGSGQGLGGIGGSSIFERIREAESTNMMEESKHNVTFGNSSGVSNFLGGSSTPNKFFSALGNKNTISALGNSNSIFGTSATQASTNNSSFFGARPSTFGNQILIQEQTSSNRLPQYRTSSTQVHLRVILCYCSQHDVLSECFSFKHIRIKYPSIKWWGFGRTFFSGKQAVWFQQPPVISAA